MMPSGVAGGVPYVALVCLGWWRHRTSSIYVLAGISSALIVLAFFLSPSAAPTILTLSNRVLALIAIWVVAALLAMAPRAESALLASNDALEAQVRERTRELEQEIAERRQAEAIITHMANHDSMTGLPIRPLFLDRLSHSLASARRTGHLVAVMFVDLDGFKTINDTLGHDAGDALLKEAAQRLVASVRETDTVARHGGDEFTVVLTDVTERKAVTTVAVKMLESIASSFRLRDQDTVISCSIGIAIFPNDSDKAELLIEHADAAMYTAKEAGKNTYAYWQKEPRPQIVAG
jgi:diguanylate cyclase (GGDEF)-like protein